MQSRIFFNEWEPVLDVIFLIMNIDLLSISITNVCQIEEHVFNVQVIASLVNLQVLAYNA